MFVNAIETAAGFTRPVHSIKRNYGSTTIQPGAATIFFVNSDGWALTCGHVAKLFLAQNELEAKWQAFRDELTARRDDKKGRRLRRELERKYEYSKKVTSELYNRVMYSIEGPSNADIKFHSKQDAALIHFTKFTRLLCDSFPVFAENGSDLKPGKFLCRVGYPFVEFSNFGYDSTADKIQWTTTGRMVTPLFSIEGMVTRLVAGDAGQTVGFELSTPGLGGQSGGPAFDTAGRIWGMQAQTAHLDLNFDVSQEVLRDGENKVINNTPFLHVGRCIHVDVLKSFMTEHRVQFKEG
jgi:hypothetical protein